MIKYILLFLLILVTSCTENYVTPNMIERAEELCKNNDGLQTVYGKIIETYQIRCNNGAKFYADVPK